MSSKKDMQQLIITHTDHLQKLKVQQATYGLNTPPHILTEIERIEAEIAELQGKLRLLDSSGDEPGSDEDTTPQGIQLAKFVNRRPQLNLIFSNLESVKHGIWTQYFILSVLGSPGIGKSTLLKKVTEEAQAQNIDTILIDYDTPAAKSNKLHVLRTVAERFFKKAVDWQEAMQAYQGSKEDPTQVTAQDHRLIEVFVENLRLKLRQKALLLLIDNSHRISNSTKQILEEMLEHVYDQNRLLVVLAGRVNLRWSSHRLRDRTRVIPLDCFEEMEAAQLLAKPINPDLSKEVYRLTNGHPLASVFAYKWAADKLKPSTSDLVYEFRAQEVEFVTELVESILTDHILRHIPDDETQARLHWLLKNVSPLRRFEDNLLYELLPELDEARFGQSTTLEARSYTRQMAALTHLIKWDGAKMAYVLDFPIRRLLALEMRFRNRSRLLKIHQLVMDWYERAINKIATKDASTPQSVIYLIEYIFHLAQLRQMKGDTKDLEHDIQQKIAHQFNGYHRQERVHFREEFSRDEELAEVLGRAYDPLAEYVVQQIGTEG